MTTLAARPIEVSAPHRPTTMRALIKHHAGTELQFVSNRPVPTPGPRDVLIRVKKVGICGTDRHIWEWDAWAAGRIPVGIVTGHEFVGTIEQVGSAVTNYKPGQRVSAEGHITAWKDYNSRTGNAHIASDTKIIGIATHMKPRPGIWPVDPERRADREAWLAKYTAAAKRYAACSFEEEVGDGATNERCLAVARLHDELAGANSRRPIA